MSSKFIYFSILFLIILNNSWAKWAFLSDQSKCNLNCLNGGVCSFLVKKPEVHKCICLIGMFEGPQCEQAIECGYMRERGCFFQRVWSIYCIQFIFYTPH
uniref:EGF-like domain-containing protein n=1 Tax=Meloidogyne incognita TaxID=6306 RepID=A0A914NL45_MELIC